MSPGRSFCKAVQAAADVGLPLLVLVLRQLEPNGLTAISVTRGPAKHVPKDVGNEAGPRRVPRNLHDPHQPENQAAHELVWDSSLGFHLPQECFLLGRPCGTYAIIRRPALHISSHVLEKLAMDPNNVPTVLWQSVARQAAQNLAVGATVV